MAEVFFFVGLIWLGSWLGVRVRQREMRRLRSHIGEEAFDRSLGTESDLKAFLKYARSSRGSFVVAGVRRVHTGGFWSGNSGDEYVLIDDAGSHHPTSDVLFRKSSRSHLQSHVGKEAFDRSLGDEAEEAAFLAGNGGRTFFTVARVRRGINGQYVLVDTAGNDHTVGNTLVRRQAQMPATEGQPQEHEKPSAIKTCPDCAEKIQAAARICRFCRHSFESNT